MGTLLMWFRPSMKGTIIRNRLKKFKYYLPNLVLLLSNSNFGWSIYNRLNNILENQ